MSRQRMGHKPIETFIEFQLIGKSKSGLTNIWQVINIMQPDHDCGRISWHGAWRKYVYEVDTPGISDWEFMRYVADFLEQKTIEHKQRIKK
jgi:hypothetical protein